ncbi:hypothetical protein [Acrocarpospora sp. B8E8]|uniref:hypothetical protein n=1 Tax=Acrocarpospora sp. B8E8 TaxID=3153572 RepID=UPI00325DD684
MTAPIEAVIRHAMAAEAELAATVRGYYFHQHPGPHMRFQRHLIVSMVVFGELEPCAHLRPGRPVPAFWFSWQPDLLTCAPCAQLVCDTLAPDPDEYECSRCGIRPVEGVRQLSHLVVYQHGGDPDLRLPTPVVHLRAGLCHGCLLNEVSDQRMAPLDRQAVARSRRQSPTDSGPQAPRCKPRRVRGTPPRKETP